MKTEILYGIHPVAEALKAGRRKFEGCYICAGEKSARLQKIRAQARKQQIQVRTVSAEHLLQLTESGYHQGIAARVSPYPLESIRSMAELMPDPGAEAFFLLLDQILDPQNLGAIIRSALSVGVNGVIIPKNRSAAPTAAVSKASAGALEHTRLIRVTNLADAMRDLKKCGLWLYGLDSAAGHDLFKTDFPRSIGLVIGGEGRGIRPRVKSQCDELIAIPQQGPLDSLNASAAAAVAMYEVLRQHRY